MIAVAESTANVEELFNFWASLGTSVASGTSLNDWEVDPYRDAVVFTRPQATNDDAWLVRGQGVVHFGLNDDTVADMYEQLSSRQLPAPPTAQEALLVMRNALARA
jgi:hypothetical protein